MNYSTFGIEKVYSVKYNKRSLLVNKFKLAFMDGRVLRHNGLLKLMEKASETRFISKLPKTTLIKAHKGVKGS